MTANALSECWRAFC